MSIKQSLHMPINFSHIHHEHIHPSLQHKFFTMPILPKSKPKFIQQHHKLPTLSKFHKPPTLSKLHHDQKQHFKNVQSQQFYNMINHTMPQIANNKMTISHHETSNETCNNTFPSKETKEKLTLVSTWQYGAWVLGFWRSPSSSCQSNVGSYFLPWKARKKDPLEEEAILMQKKNRFHQKWVCGENAQKHKDLKNYWWRWMRES